MSSKLDSYILPNAIDPLLSKQQGTTIPSTKIASCVFKAKQ